MKVKALPGANADKNQPAYTVFAGHVIYHPMQAKLIGAAAKTGAQALNLNGLAGVAKVQRMGECCDGQAEDCTAAEVCDANLPVAVWQATMPGFERLLVSQKISPRFYALLRSKTGRRQSHAIIS
jgi:hypothetical protein